MDLRRMSLALGGLLALIVLGFDPAAAAFKSFGPEDAGASFVTANGRRTAVPSIAAYALDDEPIQLDGRLDDPVWERAEAGSGFQVWDPDRGAAPSEETVFKVAYDSDAIYFAVACLESDPSNISSHLARRDRFSNSDLVSIYIDPYNDKTTGYNFKVNPRGVLMDAYMFNDGDRDDDWDAVWQAETYRDEHGWYTEIRIPFSSIRYRPAKEMVWGLQIYRYMHGRGEDTAWVTWDRETRGFISRFGELRGMRNVPPPRQLEVLPYFLQSTTDPRAPGRGDRFDNLQNAGADIKYGVTADLTVNATIQPDFGQVEADPAVLNLSPFETFFDEKRPFFIEGSRFFSHPDFNLFYSRRIGTGDVNSRIRFAGKLTGKTAGNVSVAALLATTDIAGHGRAHNIFEGGTQDRHYFVGRVGKEFDDGNYRINLMQTVANKTADREEYGNFASRDAYTTGLDFAMNFKDRIYTVSGSYVRSFIAPEPLAGEPGSGDTRHGHGGNVALEKLGGTYVGSIYGRWESDGLDLNDVGFLSAPDEMNAGMWLGYRYNPDGESRLFNRGNLNFNLWKNWLYAGRTGTDINTGEVAWSYGAGHRELSGGNVNGWMQLRNYWSFWYGVSINAEGTQRYETRGGPLMSEPFTYGGWWGIESDSRKDLNGFVEANYFVDTADNESLVLNLGLGWNQSSTFNHRISVGFRNRLDDTQYLETVNLNDRPGGRGIGGLSYVFGDIHQQTFDLTLRTNILFDRNQSLEVYAQPFISVGDYARVRELARPDSYDLIPYEEPGYRASDFDFSYSAVNLNAVYRWEYRPGSTLYLVWTHSRDSYAERSFYSEGTRFDNGIAADRLFNTEPENVFLAKISYWFAL